MNYSLLTLVGVFALTFYSYSAQYNPKPLSDADRQLFEAAKEDNLEEAEKALHNNANVNARTGNKWTPLIAATASGHRPIIELLINAGADVNAQTNVGSTPMHLAVVHTRPDIVGILMKAGANVNIQDHFGATPLMSVASSHYQSTPEILDMINLLLMSGARTNIEDNQKKTVLDYAKNSPDKLKLISRVIAQKAIERGLSQIPGFYGTIAGRAAEYSYPIPKKI